MPLYTGHGAHIGMLPEVPGTVVTDRVHIVMGYPIGVTAKDTVIEVTQFELVGSIEDGGHTVMALDEVQPGLDGALQVGLAPPLSGLHIKDGGQVTFLQTDGTDEEVGLAARIGTGDEIMVGTPDKAVSPGGIEVGAESLVAVVPSFCGLEENEAQRKLSGTLPGQKGPIDVALIVGDVDAMHLVIAGQTNAIPLQPVARLPAIGIGADEEPIETSRQHHHQTGGHQPAQPSRRRADRGGFLCLLRAFSGGRTTRRGRLAGSRFAGSLRRLAHTGGSIFATGRHRSYQDSCYRFFSLRKSTH